MGPSRIIANPQERRERVDLTQWRQNRRIARTVADDAADVHIFHRGIGDFAGLVKRGELINARLGHSSNANMRGAASGFFVHVSSRENTEKSCFADLR